MSRKAPKTEVVAFKVEAELAKILESLPNKSAFIRRSIIAQLCMACPLCQGTGMVPKGLHDHYAEAIGKLNLKHCEGCGDEVKVPTEPGDLTAEDRARLEQFFHGGPFFCDDCYDKAPACDDCGWHIAPEKAAEHHRAHAV